MSVFIPRKPKFCPQCGGALATHMANGVLRKRSDYLKAVFCGARCQYEARSPRPAAETLREHLEQLLDKSKGPTSCWEIIAECRARPSGLGSYGVFTYRKKSYRAHRLALELSGVSVPRHLWVLHSCDNPPCCNPRHLRTGTREDNVQDAVERRRYGGRTGQNNPNAKLTPTLVAQMRREAKIGVLQKDICKKYGVSMQALRWALFGLSCWAGEQGGEKPLVAGPRGQNRGKLSTEQRKEVGKLLSAGETDVKISKIFGIAPAAVRYWRKKNGAG